ncbi:MAG: NAD(P)/FAD-dependent oxidoreductase [Gemmatimonas sp.]
MKLHQEDSADVIVIGAGIAGLVCAIELVRAGRSVRILEAAGAVGGRVSSSELDGCVIDHGFQVMFTAYPTITQYLDIGALALRTFRPAAHVVVDNRVSLIGDALRDPTLLLDTVAPGVIPMADKLRLLALRRFAKGLTVEECFSDEYASVSTRAFLIGRGFGTAVVDAFFAPFYGGILLDRTLSTNASVLLFTFKMLSEGDTAVPARGMGAIPQQLADQLPEGSVRLNTRVRAIMKRGDEATGVVLENGAEVSAADVVVATDPQTAATLLRTVDIDTEEGRTGSGSVSLYFRSAEAVLPGKALWLNGDVTGAIAHAITLTEVAPEYAGHGALTVATSFGPHARASDAELEAAARTTFAHFSKVAPFDTVRDLSLVKVWRTPYAQFSQPPGFRPASPRVSDTLHALWRASELLHSSSIEGAARGGKMAAMALLGARAGTTH